MWKKLGLMLLKAGSWCLNNPTEIKTAIGAVSKIRK